MSVLRRRSTKPRSRTKLDGDAGEEEDALLASKEFNNIRRIHLEKFSELGIRRYDAFLYDGLLSHYRPEYAASPLRNPKTARVFAHYIHVVSGTRYNVKAIEV
jgi:hypothetical protein